MDKNKTYRDEALRAALHREQSKLKVPSRLAENVMRTIQEGAVQPAPQKPWLFRLAIPAIAAACVLALILIVPHIKKEQDLSRYEGSYIEVHGKRISDLDAIQVDINEALAMADMAESHAPKPNLIQTAEEAVLEATDDPEMRATLQRMLDE